MHFLLIKYNAVIYVRQSMSKLQNCSFHFDETLCHALCKGTRRTR
jgi:hypothetical protein